MALTSEWRLRIEQWLNILRTLVYEPLGSITFEGSLTRTHLDAADLPRASFKPMPAGTCWGAMWEYCWFKGAVTLPASARGARIVLCADVGGESAVLIDGVEAGAIDGMHKEITLTRSGVPGTRYNILIEAYAGHGPTPCGNGPVPHGVASVPLPPPRQRTVGTSTFGIWHEDVYQAWLDAATLLQLRDHIDKDALRVAEIDEALRAFTCLADPELPRAEMLRTVRAARARLKPLLACRNGSTAPRLYCFGHSHIDVAWLWPLAETLRKCRRTFATQLALMEEYPEFVFLQSQAHLYWMVKQSYPRLYRRLQDAARRGQWIPDGGMWVEPDTNLAGGESLIRQFLFGKRFFQKEFGASNELMWLPDVFGYSGALPQIMKGCGIKYFSTQKIFWAYHGGDPFPYNTFWWEGIDGSRILAHIHTDYGSVTEPRALIQRWNDRVQKDGIVSRLFPFGYGDGGGGPLRDHLEYLRRCKDLEGVPQTVQCAPVDFFRDEMRRRARLPVYVGELYYQCHRGTYTSQARVKKGNRRCEIALRELELWGAAAALCATKAAYPFDKAEELWRTVLMNQFHDILPGSSIARVYEEAGADHARVELQARELCGAAQHALVRAKAGTVTVFNSLAWARTALVPLPKDFTGARDAAGQALVTQHIDGVLHARATLPSCGWTTLTNAPAAAVTTAAVRATTSSLENDVLRIKLNRSGEIVSLYDKQARRELAAGPGNRLLLYKDVPTCFDAWDIDATYKENPVEIGGRATVSVVAQGPLAGVVRVQRTFSASTLQQDIILRAGSRVVEFKTTMDWHERHKLLKVSFPVNVHNNEAVHEIQFGHLRRPTHASRQFDADRFEVSAHKWSALTEEDYGVAVLNDCKYGVSVTGNAINLTLLKAPLSPDMTADLGRHEFSYAVYAWQGSLFEGNVVRAGYELNMPAMVIAGAAEERSLFALDAPNVVIEAVKPAEDGSGDVIVRLYEAMRSDTSCRLQTTLPVVRAHTATMLEEPLKPVAAARGQLRLHFRPFEIKTLRLRCDARR